MVLHPIVAKDVVEKRISEVFPDLKDPLKGQYVQLVTFLCDMTAVVERLKKLDKQLEFLKNIHEVGDNDIQGQKKILSNFLGQSEVSLGFAGKFTQTHHPTFAKSGGLLPTLTGYGEPEDVKDLIQQGSHWRDIGVSTAHGEYSHRLQWYAIAQSGMFTESDIKNLYTQSVSEECTSNYYSKIYYMWDFAVDCFERNHEQTPSRKEQQRLAAYDDFADSSSPISIRFRSPAILNRYLWSAKELKFLSRFTTGRKGIHESQDSAVLDQRKKLNTEQLRWIKKNEGSNRSAASRREVREIGMFVPAAKNIYVPKKGH